MSTYQQFRAYVGQRYREVALYPQISLVGAKPKAMFFPSSLREGASHLRAYNVAEALQELGWSTAVVPKQLGLEQRSRLVRHYDPDLLFFQQCRHEFNDARHAFGRPYVLDIDDADFFEPALHNKIARTCAGAQGVIAGSRFIADWCSRYNASTRIVWTGTPVTDAVRPGHEERPPVIAWAQRAPLRYPRELDFIRAFHAALTAAGKRFTLRLYGASTEAERDKLKPLFGPDADLQLYPLMKYDDFIRSLYGVSIGLSPIIFQSEFSRGKSFGKILAYLDAKVPVIASDEADHALFFGPDSGVVSNDLETWVQSAASMLESPGLRDRMAGHAFHDFRSRLTTEAAAAEIDGFLRTLVPARALQPALQG